MENLQKLMDDIAEWSDLTFGDGQRNPAIAYHLQKEVVELINSIEEYQKYEHKEEDLANGSVQLEFADCFMLLLDSASHFGLSANDLMKVTELKLGINKQRKWGKPDKNGVVEHLK